MSTSPLRPDHLLAVFRNDLRVVAPSTILIAQRDLRDGISGFCCIDPDRGIFDTLPAPGGRAGLIRIGPRDSRTCRLVPDLQIAMITALMTATDPALIVLMPDNPDPEQQTQIDRLLSGRTVEIVLPKAGMSAPGNVRLMHAYPDARVIGLDPDTVMAALRCTGVPDFPPPQPG